MESLGSYLVVNYHYVEDPRPDHSGIHPCPVAEFERQVRFLSEHSRIVSVPEVLEAARGKRAGVFSALTFDDGLADNYQYALPALMRHRATATFFPVSSTLEGVLPATHKIHFLLSNIPSEKLVSLLEQFLKDRHPDLAGKYPISRDRKMSVTRVYETTLTANFKEVIALLPNSVREEFLADTFRGHFQNEKEIAAQLFLTREQIRELADRGMAIGSHSHSHHSLRGLDEAALRREFELSQKNLAGIVGRPVEVFSYPHGHYRPEMFPLLKAAGFHYGVTIEPRAARVEDDPFMIPRYDTNHLRDYLNQIAYPSNPR